MASSKMFTVDKFLGIDQSADSARELKMGQASKVCNFALTDGGNITTRPGLVRAYSIPGATPRTIWSGHLGASNYMIVVASNGIDESACTSDCFAAWRMEAFNSYTPSIRPSARAQRYSRLLGISIFSAECP